jgi:hypothetical protein
MEQRLREIDGLVLMNRRRDAWGAAIQKPADAGGSQRIATFESFLREVAASRR